MSKSIENMDNHQKICTKTMFIMTNVNYAVGYFLPNVYNLKDALCQ